jgi:hypothetical protein
LSTKCKLGDSQRGSKIDVQLKLFTEQMQYQRGKDRRLYENALIANENAWLAIQKQGEVIRCLAELSFVLCKALNMARKSDSEGSAHVGAFVDSAHKVLNSDVSAKGGSTVPSDTTSAAVLTLLACSRSSPSLRTYIVST